MLQHYVLYPEQETLSLSTPLLLSEEEEEGDQDDVVALVVESDPETNV